MNIVKLILMFMKLCSKLILTFEILVNFMAFPHPNCLAVLMYLTESCFYYNFFF